jgi:hypothetical protein
MKTFEMGSAWAEGPPKRALNAKQASAAAIFFLFKTVSQNNFAFLLSRT